MQYQNSEWEENLQSSNLTEGKSSVIYLLLVLKRKTFKLRFGTSKRFYEKSIHPNIFGIETKKGVVKISEVRISNLYWKKFY